MSFLARARSPFLLFVSSPDPHHPFTPPRPWADLFDAVRMPLPERVPGELDKLAPLAAQRPGSEWIDNAASAVEQGGMAATASVSDDSLRRAIALTRGMEAMIDDAFGKVLDALGRLGHAEDTVVVFTSDHGEFLGHHGLLHKGPPPFGDLNRVSMVMAGPGVPEGECHDALTSHLDLMPTVLDLAGVSGEGLALDGQTFRPVLEGSAPQREALHLEFHPRIQAETYNHSIQTATRRLTLYPAEADWGELFDLERDPGEHDNVYLDSRYRAERDRLIERLTNDFPASPGAGTTLLAKW